VPALRDLPGVPTVTHNRGGIGQRLAAEQLADVGGLFLWSLSASRCVLAFGVPFREHRLHSEVRCWNASAPHLPSQLPERTCDSSTARPEGKREIGYDKAYQSAGGTGALVPKQASEPSVRIPHTEPVTITRRVNSPGGLPRSAAVSSGSQITL